MTSANKFTIARALHCLAVTKGERMTAEAYAQAQGWIDSRAVVAAIKGAITANTSADFAAREAGEAFVEAMRPFSIPGQLEGLVRVAMHARVFEVSTRIAAEQVLEGGAIPVLRGSWGTTTITPKKFAGITVKTAELVRATSPAAQAAIQGELAEAVAEAENAAFVSPWNAASVLYGAPSFASTGIAGAHIGADMRRALDFVPRAYRGGAWLMHPLTAAFLSGIRDSGGACFPNVSVKGGEAMGLPVLVTEAMEDVGSPIARAIGLLSPTEIEWAEGEIELDVSSEATLVMDDDAGASAANQTSLFQADAVAVRAIKTAGWHARSGAGAYFTVGF